MKTSENFFNQCGKRSSYELIIEGMFKVHGEILDVKILNVFSENGIPRILYLLLATANAIMNYLDFASIVEKQVTKLYCFFGF